MAKEKTIAVVGATGAVGRVMLQVLEEMDFPAKEVVAFATEKSAGEELPFKGGKLIVKKTEEGSFKDIDIALFSAGASTAKILGPQAVREGAVVVDNSSAFRRDPEIPLVVPEVNREALKHHEGLIANPNCSTIQMLVALKPLHDAAKLKRIIVSTYQAVSGAGQKAIEEMLAATKASLAGEAFDYEKFVNPIAFNALPHIDIFLEQGYTKEEMKMLWETRKIFGDESIEVSATCVRLPVVSGHSESIHAEFSRPIDPEEAKMLWQGATGVVIEDEPSENRYPMAIDAVGKNEVFVGRIRPDLFNERALNFWCVADNLRKGEATNTVQIAQCLIEDGLL